MAWGRGVGDAQVIKSVVEHMQFLGYADNVEVVDGDRIHFLAHPSKWNVIATEFNGGVTLRIRYRLHQNEARQNRSKLMDLLNLSNRHSAISTYFVEEDLSVITTTYWLASYSREEFGVVMTALENDIRLIGSEEISRFIQ